MKAFIILVLFYCFFSNPSAEGKWIKPVNKKLQYVGRFDFSDSLEPKCSYTYSSIEAKFFGTHLSVSFTEYALGDEQHTNYIEVILDKRPFKTLKLDPGTHDYLISDELPINYHNVRFVKRTEASVGVIGFNGLRIKGKTLYEVVKKKVKLMVIGSSWSTGYGNELMLFSDYKRGFHSKNQDGNITWGSIIASYYNADLHNISASDAAVFRGIDGKENHSMIDRLDLIHPSDTIQKWNHSKYQPDLIYVYLGSADFIPECEIPPNKLDSLSFVSNYTKLISKLTDIYPNAFILCICGDAKSNWFPAGFRQYDRWINYTKAVVDIFAFLEKPIFFKHLSSARRPWGEDGHPTKVIHHRIAYEIRDYFPFIRKKSTK